MKVKIMHKTGTLFVIYGPTGGGKTTICHEAARQLADKGIVQRLVTYTTRPPRPGEQDGIDYHFIDRATFEGMQVAEKFFETNRYDGHWYGTPRNLSDTLATGMSLLVVTDRNGAQKFKEAIPDTLLLWVGLFDIEELSTRIRHRAQHDPHMTPEALESRLTMAAQEVAIEEEAPIYTLYFLNQDWHKTASLVAGFIEFYRSSEAEEVV